jgi:superfamily I DNA/RNA helicase
MSETTTQFNKEFAKIYRNYQTALQQNRLLDFDDLITQTVRLLQTQPDALTHYQRRFRWISVDEYQDINLAQYQFLRLLTTPETNLCAIGDPDQAIYGFRGANRTYFMKFEADFPHAKILHLSRNYRSTQLILDASSQVIEKSPAEERIKIWSEFVDKTKISVHRSPTDKAESEYTVHEIEKMVGGTSYFSIDSGRLDDDTIKNRSFADFAVLYRLNAQSYLLAKAFDRSGIPYQIVGQTPLHEVKEIQHILAYLWLATNPNSGFHLEKVLNQKKTVFTLQDLDNLQRFAGKYRASLADTLSKSEQMDFLTATQRKRLATVASFCHELAETAGNQPVTALIDRVRKSINQPQTERLAQFVLSAALFDNRLTDFLESTLLQRDSDIYNPQADRVTLMTLHAAKGLEFPVVFIVGCEENLLPYKLGNIDFDLDEERRLFYVGMTRAQQQLVLTYANTRFLFGERWHNQPSPFVNDIENTLKELSRMTRQKKRKKNEDPSAQLSLF